MWLKSGSILVTRPVGGLKVRLMVPTETREIANQLDGVKCSEKFEKIAFWRI